MPGSRLTNAVTCCLLKLRHTCVSTLLTSRTIDCVEEIPNARFTFLKKMTELSSTVYPRFSDLTIRTFSLLMCFNIRTTKEKCTKRALMNALREMMWIILPHFSRNSPSRVRITAFCHASVYNLRSNQHSSSITFWHNLFFFPCTRSRIGKI